MASTIQHLKKVKLTILAGSEPEGHSLTPCPVVFEFLYGIGAEGLEPFEMELSDKCSGDSLALMVTAGDVSAFFGRFWRPIRQLLGLHFLPSTLCLHLTVTSVTDAENREMVHALARSAGHGGCGGSCDCGCGLE
jgi:hypothetical protein